MVYRPEILILGKGFIGKQLCAYLNCKIFSKKELDYTDSNIFKIYLNNFEPKFVINASGYTGYPNVDACELEKNKKLCYKLNVHIPRQLAVICHNKNIPFANISSGCIYNGYNFTEESKPNHIKGYYCKTKYECEQYLINYNCYQWRIRIPFCSQIHNKNYLTKLLKYDRLINKYNSLTCIEDFCEFVYKFIKLKSVPEYGIYNVVNENYVNADYVIDLLKSVGLQNPNWIFVDEKDLDLKCKRSNCVLVTSKIKKLGLGLPYVRDSLKECINEILSKFKI